MTTTAPRVRPLAEDEWTPEAREVLDGLAMNGRVLNIFRTLAHHPKLLKRWLVFGNHVLVKSTLPPRERELLILRTGWNCRAEYEWGQHAEIARHVGLTDAEIGRVTRGADDPAWAPQDAVLLRAADELHADSRIGDATWAALAARYTTEQLLDLIFTVGQYTLVSMALNSLGVTLDDGVAGFPR
jgi:4-carboxymuconolactone decarboxylase